MESPKERFVMCESRRQKVNKWLKAQAYAEENVYWDDVDHRGDYLFLEELVKYLPDFIEELINT